MKFSLYFIFVLIPFLSIAQPAKRGIPVSFLSEEVVSLDQVSTEKMKPFDLEKLLRAENQRNADGKQRPFLFGKSFDVNFDLNNSGTSDWLSNGDRIWRLKVFSEGANTINLRFGKFVLHSGSKLFIYNKDRSEVLGAYTQEHNRDNQQFNTSVIRGEEVIVELYQKQENIGKDELKVAAVIHGFRGFGAGGSGARDFGTSGACNNNVVCPEGDGWRDDIRASAMILSAGGTRLCSGSLINNTSEDGTPYFLTANHCIVDFFGELEDVSNWVYLFNYESSDCAGTLDGPLNQTVQGSQVVAHFEDSDFGLLLLDEAPPIDYDVYYSGWSAKDEIYDSVVCIHHPDGDIKKISFEFDSTVSDSYSGSTDKTHWKVPDWDDGTTEPGSSGSPLFNKYHQIIGQLHGGTAKCGNNDPDYYGKVAYSWVTDSTKPEQNLKDWLDPSNKGVLELNGRDFNSPEDTIDGAIKSLDIASNVCGDTMYASFTIKNFGYDSLISVNLTYELDGISKTINWNGELKFLEEDKISIPATFVSQGTHKLQVFLSNPNNKEDDNVTNDTLIKVFNSTAGNDVEFHMLTDFFGSQTKVYFKNENDSLVYYRDGFESSTLYEEGFCLPNGCYSLRITDAGADGICCNYEEGYFSLQLANGSVMDTVAFGGEFEDTIHVNFCLEDSKYLGVKEESEKVKGVKVYPNPAKDRLYVSNMVPGWKRLEVYTALGSLKMKQETSEQNIELDIKNLETGIYYVRVVSGDIVRNRKIVVRK